MKNNPRKWKCQNWKCISLLLWRSRHSKNALSLQAYISHGQLNATVDLNKLLEIHNKYFLTINNVKVGSLGKQISLLEKQIADVFLLSNYFLSGLFFALCCFYTFKGATQEQWRQHGGRVIFHGHEKLKLLSIKRSRFIFIYLYLFIYYLKEIIITD